jgi:predicted ArsR family transcriptional regulator
MPDGSRITLRLRAQQPRPSADRFQILLKTRRPQTTADLGKATGVTGEAARPQLARRADDGLLVATVERRGVGRPAHVSALREAGNARFPDVHGELTAQLIRTIRTQVGADVLDRIIDARAVASRTAYAAALKGAADLGEHVARPAQARSREGYMAESWTEGEGYVLVKNDRPICVAATSCQGFGRAGLDTFRELLGPDASVERTEQIVAGDWRCVHRIARRLPARGTDTPSGSARQTPMKYPPRRAEVQWPRSDGPGRSTEYENGPRGDAKMAERNRVTFERHAAQFPGCSWAWFAIRSPLCDVRGRAAARRAGEASIGPGGESHAVDRSGRLTQYPIDQQLTARHPMKVSRRLSSEDRTDPFSAWPGRGARRRSDSPAQPPTAPLVERRLGDALGAKGGVAGRGVAPRRWDSILGVNRGRRVAPVGPRRGNAGRRALLGRPSACDLDGPASE